MDYHEIRLSLGNEVGELRLCRPQTRNAMNEAMGAEIESAVPIINGASNLRVLIVRGEGTTFSSGGDFAMLEERARRAEPENRASMQRFYRSFLSIRQVRVPTIAVLHGAAIGAGLCFAMACDLRIARAGTRLGANFVRVGLHPGMGASFLLPQLIGTGPAAELLLTGRTIDADRALLLGLVHQVHDGEALDPAVQALAEEIAGAAPLAVAQTKQTLKSSIDRALEQALDVEAGEQARDFGSADFREALSAFESRRKPRFSGQ